jgi:uncharacterized tellurite resistance protein B-like protein
VGLLDRLKRRPAELPPSGQLLSTPTPQLSTNEAASSRGDPWVPLGVGVRVGRFDIGGGLLYVGDRLPAPNGSGPDPALINPRLPLDVRSPDWSASTVGYWPSYSTITPSARAAYLAWLSAGRDQRGAPISWVFLYFYGLERRVLHDQARGDLPEIEREVRRLLDRYGDNRSFRSYGTQFLAALGVLTAFPATDLAPPPHDEEVWPVPARLTRRLGEFARSGEAVPAEWALAWAHYHPEIYPRTPARRCPAEFAELFAIRYAARHGAGIVVRPGRATIRHTYQSASAGLGLVSLGGDVPDVLQLAGPTRKLAALVEECTDALDGYSRLLGRRPAAAGTLPALALLPVELLREEDPRLAELRSWAEGRLGTDVQAVAEADELSAFWPGTAGGKLAKTDAVALAQVLGALGVGIEPDVRLGGPVLNGGKIVLFRAESRQPSTASAAYAGATTLLHLAASVSLADGSASESELGKLREHVAGSVHLLGPERRRLAAHLAWLLAVRPTLTGLTKRLAQLDSQQREAIGDFLILVATADGVVAPGEIGMLTKIFGILDLDVSSLYGRLHVAGLSAPSPAEPVIVRPEQQRPGYAVPPPRPTTRVVRLDQAALDARLAETTAVSALLATVFRDDEDAEVPPTPRHPQAAPLVAGLDEAHSSLLRRLASATSWSLAGFVAVCGELDLLPNGALDTMNDAALDKVGEPLLDGDDPIDINPEVLQEMLA